MLEMTGVHSFLIEWAGLIYGFALALYHNVLIAWIPAGYLIFLDSSHLALLIRGERKHYHGFY
jgi:hypothetical protein